jgi:cytochrome c oxidase cbb3-type subunit III
MANIPERDDITGIDTTGHEWDGIKELNNPLPRWWVLTFYVCIVWAIVYAALMPSVPYFKDGEMVYYKGYLNYSQRDAVIKDIMVAEAAKSEHMEQIAAAALSDIKADEDLLSFAVRGGRAAFGDNCAPCHGSGAQGFAGFPNLNDDDWIWGGTLEDIYITIQNGVRWDSNDDTRLSDMPKFLDDEMLNRDQIRDVTQYVLSLSGSSSNAEGVVRGAEVFLEQCAMCHGESGGGNRLVGAPNLSDAIWLYGGSEQEIFTTIAHSRRGVMPAWAGRLDEATIKQLALYVHGLGGGEQNVKIAPEE